MAMSLLELREYLKTHPTPEPEPKVHDENCRCSDCYYKIMGEQIEKHPIASPPTLMRHKKLD